MNFKAKQAVIPRGRYKKSTLAAIHEGNRSKKITSIFFSDKLLSKYCLNINLDSILKKYPA